MNFKLSLLMIVLAVVLLLHDDCSAWLWNSHTHSVKEANRKTKLDKVNEMVNKFHRQQFAKYASRPQMYSILTRVGKRAMSEKFDDLSFEIVGPDTIQINTLD